jgi:hypothetical protein
VRWVSAHRMPRMNPTVGCIPRDCGRVSRGRLRSSRQIGGVSPAEAARLIGLSAVESVDRADAGSRGARLVDGGDEGGRPRSGRRAATAEHSSGIATRSMGTRPHVSKPGRTGAPPVIAAPMPMASRPAMNPSPARVDRITQKMRCTLTTSGQMLRTSREAVKRRLRCQSMSGSGGPEDRLAVPQGRLSVASHARAGCHSRPSCGGAEVVIRVGRVAVGAGWTGCLDKRCASRWCDRIRGAIQAA